MALTIILILLQIIDIGQVISVSSRHTNKVYAADYYAPVVKLFTFVSTSYLLLYLLYIYISI